MISADMKWERLHEDVYRAVEEGFDRGLDCHPETTDGGRFIAFRYILDLMDKLDGGAE